MGTDRTTRRLPRAPVRFLFSFSRRDVEGRLLGALALSLAVPSETYLSRGRSPERAASATERLSGGDRSNFVKTPIAMSGMGCWGDWFKSEITVHDGLVERAHPRLRKAVDRSMSATSLKVLLRDPILLCMALCSWLESARSSRRAAIARRARLWQPRAWHFGTGGQ